MRPFNPSLLLVLGFAFAACTIDTAPEGAERAHAGTGPKVVFDLVRRPLPELPQPNDVATVADPTSRTGRRINVSMIAPTRLDREGREGFASMEGWGTFSPVTVAFEKSAGTPSNAAAIDLDRIAARMTGDGGNFSDDPVYLVNLRTGVPVPLDVGSGSFPVVVTDPSAYWPNDSHAADENLLFESTEEAPAGTPYASTLDKDGDGVLDTANTFVRTGQPPGAIPKVDNLLTWYERASDTLILRPLLPLDEMTEYAVVLTDRLTDSSGGAVRSPFEYVHHHDQKGQAERVRAIFDDSVRSAYFGDLSGTGLSHVAFTWSFTTQPVYDDMRRLRDGLDGQGPFARFAGEYSRDVEAKRAAGLSVYDDAAVPNEGADPRCAGRIDRPFIVRVDQAIEQVDQLVGAAFGVSGSEKAVLIEALKQVSHLVIGVFEAPFMLGDPTQERATSRFRADYQTGDASVSRGLVPFVLAVPKPRNGVAQPFSTVLWSHGSGLFSLDLLSRAGEFARQGLAMMAIDLPGHGLVLDEGQRLLGGALLGKVCYKPFLAALDLGRAQDLNGDGTKDSGGLLWSAHLFHTRDTVRQSVLDQMMATRVLRSFDGKKKARQDFSGANVALSLAGDFDADGTPDVGGVNARLYASGHSLGGIVALLHGAVDHEIAATAAISPGGGFMDIALRSSLITNAVVEQTLSPLVVGVPAESRKPTGKDGTRCTAGDTSVRFVLNDLIDSREVEIACLHPNEIATGAPVVLTNVTTGERRCAVVGEESRFRVPIPATIGDRLDVQLFAGAADVPSLSTCASAPNATPGRRIQTFEQAFVEEIPVEAEGRTCAAFVEAQGFEPRTPCAQFRDRYFPVGSSLVAPQEGLGLHRQTPDFRRLMSLSQAALDPSDPVNFASLFMLREAKTPLGASRGPRPVGIFTTVGDPYVPTSSGIAFARAAGVVPFLPPEASARFPELAEYATPAPLYEALERKTPNDVLIENHVVEGQSRLGRTRGGPTCTANYRASASCPKAPDPTADCAGALYDADWLSEGRDLVDAPHPKVPLRLARKANIRAITDADLLASWAPRLAGAPFVRDGDVPFDASPLAALVNAYDSPRGQHVFALGDPCRAFDHDTYYSRLVVRFLATSGTDLYFLSHPSSHGCLADQTCSFLK